jgi:magnesium transporter
MTDKTQQDNPLQAIDQINQVLDAGELDKARELLSGFHPSEIADVLEGLPSKQRETTWQLIEPAMEGDVLAHIQDAVRADLLEQMRPQEVAEVTRDLEADVATDILQDLPEDVIDSVLLAMDEQNRQRVTSMLSYSEDTAGGLMNIDVVSVRADVTLDTVARYLRLLGQIPEKTDQLMVVDRDNHYLGVLALTDVLIRDPDEEVGAYMTETDGLSAATPASEVVRLFEQRDLVSAAVVDGDQRLLGRITVDDVVDVIQDEAEQTVRSMAGLGDDDMFAPVFTSARRRGIWLGINLTHAFLASWVIGRFEETIQQLVALAVLMPIVASMGGIAGSQTLTIAIRGIAVGQIARSNIRALFAKEIAVGVLNGLMWACVVAVVVIIWFEDTSLGVIIGLAMVINLVVAAFAGAIIPLGLKHYGIDPAIAGGVILTTITDVVGFLTFLGLATLFLLS